MMKRQTFAIVLLVLLVSVTAWGQSQVDWSRYLIIPEPDCALAWESRDADYDSLRANPVLSLERLKQELSRAQSLDAFTVGKLNLDLAHVYSYLDSTAAAQIHNKEALAQLEHSYNNRPTAQTAYLIGLVTEDLEDDKDALPWFDRALDLDPDHYLAMFKRVEVVDKKDDAGFERWVKRAKKLAERLLESDLDPKKRAAVAFHYANWQTSLVTQRNPADIFRVFADLVEQFDEGEDNDNQVAAQMFTQFQMMAGGPNPDKTERLLRMAIDLDQTNVQYQLRYAAWEINQIFFGSIARVAEEDKYSDQEDLDFEDFLSRGERNALMAIRDRLVRISLSHPKLYPAALYYRAFVDAAMGEYQLAHQALVEFVQLHPEHEPAKSLYCISCYSLVVENPDNRQRYLGEMMGHFRQRYYNSPSAQDCYRFGYFSWQTGELQDSYDIFQFACTLGGEDYRAKVATAVCAFEMGNHDRARTFIRSLEQNRNDLDEAEASYLVLRAVIAAENGNLADARYWADQALESDDDNSAVIGLHQALH